MRAPFLSLICLALTPSAFAQSPSSPPAGSDWSRVQRVVVGTEVRIRQKRVVHATIFDRSRVDCLFITASEDEVVCNHTFKIFFVPIHHEFRIARLDVASVRMIRGDLSSFVGGVIGAGTGVGFVGILAASHPESDHSEDFLAYSLVAVLGASIGSGIGRATDFMGGPTIYRAP